MEFIAIEPRDGGEVDRLVTVLLNLTGLVSCVLERSRDPGSAGGVGVELIDRAAEWLRGSLSVVAEHYSDEELVAIIGILAHCILVTADDLGLGDVLRDEPPFGLEP
jgi:hypothetical protein